MKESLEMSARLNETAENLYRDWLDNDAHSKFTGSLAEVDPVIHGKFSAWEGYITGTILALEPFHKIVQSWRTTEFNLHDEDSMLEVIFESLNGKTKLTLKHFNIPQGQANNYKKGWKDFYFKPMQQYYSRKNKV